jgi:hypothetical protein
MPCAQFAWCRAASCGSAARNQSGVTVRLFLQGSYKPDESANRSNCC